MTQAVSSTRASYPANTCQGKHKMRLFVGSGNFTEIIALIQKHEATHPNLASAITATNFEVKYLQSHQATINYLRKKGVEISIASVDATKIDQIFKERHFERIHWNCPFIGNQHEQRRQLREVVLPQFFKSASCLQKPLDRIHVTLRQQQDYYAKRRVPFRYENQANHGIVKAATGAGYRLIKKRHFDTRRYPGYIDEAFVCEKREFVFEKVEPILFEEMIRLSKRAHSYVDHDQLSLAKRLRDSGKKAYEVKVIGGCFFNNFYYECKTDDESSDYESKTQSKASKVKQNVGKRDERTQEIELFESKEKDSKRHKVADANQ